MMEIKPKRTLEVGLASGGSALTLTASHRDLGSEPSRQQRHPTIEDNVTIYAGATILGGDTVIGEGSVIGGNVWLVRSTPPHSKIFGKAKE